MKEAGLDLEPDGEQRGLAARGQALEHRRLGGERGAALNAQRLVGARHHEQQRHLGIGEDVLEAQDHSVALALGDEQRALVLDQHESGLVALRRHVGGALGARRSPTPGTEPAR